MNRKLALVGSVSAAVVLVSGAVMVGSPAQLVSRAGTSTPELSSAPIDTASATATSQDPVVVYQDDYEYVAGGDPAGAPSATPATVGDAGGPGGAQTMAPPVTTGGRCGRGTSRRPGDVAAHDRRSGDHHDPTARCPEGLAGRQADPADAAELPGSAARGQRGLELSALSGHDPRATGVSRYGSR